MDATDRDFLIRTVLGEAGSEPDLGQAAVAHVVLNRLQRGDGKSVRDVVLAPGQFEPWQTRPGALMQINPASPDYQRAASIVDGVLSGEIEDPTGGATHFLNPNEVVRRSGGVPAWANKDQGVRIGNHVFHAPEGAVSRSSALDAINAGLGTKTDLAGAGVAPLAFAEASAAPANPSPSPKATAMPAPKASPAASDPFSAWGVSLDDGPAKSAAPKSDPFAAWGVSLDDKPAPTSGAAQGDLPQGEWWQGQNDPSLVGTATRAGLGVIRGGKDVLDTLSHGLASGTDAAAAYLASKGLLPQSAADAVHRSAADAIATDQKGMRGFAGEYGDSGAATGGRIAGNIAATVPVLAAGGAALGVDGAAPIVGNRLLDLAAKGAVIGGASNALTASASDKPFLDHVGEGAAAGAVLGPVAAGAGKVLAPVGNKLVEYANGFRPQTAATNALLRAMQDSGLSPQEAAARLASNPRLSLMDIDPNLQQRAMGIASQPGPGRAVLDQAVQGRMAGANDAVSSAYDAAAGSTPDPLALLASLKKAASDNAAKGFGDALNGAKPVNVSPVLDAIDAKLNPGVMGKVSSNTTDIPMSPAQQELARVRAMLSDGDNVLTDANRLHEIQSDLRRTSDTLASSANGQDRLTAQALRDVRGKLVGQIDEAAGGKYRPAQAQYADDKAVEDAFNKGLDVFRNRPGAAGLEDRPEAWRAAIADMSDAERGALRQGVRTSIDQQINSVRAAARKGTDLPDVPFNKAKLSAVLGPEETMRLQRVLQDEQAIAQTNQRLFQNSQTVPRQEGVKATAVRTSGGGLGWDIGIPIAGGVGVSPEAGVALTLAALGRRGLQYAGQRSDIARNRLMADSLSATGPARDRAINLLLEAAGRGQEGLNIPPGLVTAGGVQLLSQLRNGPVVPQPAPNR